MTLIKQRSGLFLAVLLLTSSSAYSDSVLNATANSALIDGNGNSVANPGEEIQYVVTVSNISVQDANTVALASSIDTNAAIVSDAKIASSGAFDDCYGTAIDTAISPNSANGILINDLEGLTIIAGNVTSKQGVTVTINSDGTFSYTPPASYSGTDSFVYSALSADGEINQGIITVAILAGLSGPEVANLQTITGTSDPASVVTALVTDLNLLGSRLTGALSAATTAGLKTDIDTLRTSIDNKTTASVSAGLAALTNLISSTPSGNLITDATNIILAVDGTSVGSLSSKVSTVSDLIIASSSKTNLQGDITAVETKLGGTGTLTARVDALSTSIASTPSNVSADLATALTTLGGSGSLITRSNAINTQLNDSTTLAGGSGNLAARLTGISGTILSTPSGDITADLSTSRSLLVNSPGATLQADVQTLNTELDGGATGSTTEARVMSLVGSIQDSATQGNTALSSVASKIGRDLNLTSNQDIYRMLTDANSGIESGILSKINSTQPSSVLTGLKNIARIVSGGTTLTGSATSNLVAKLGDAAGNNTLTNFSTIVGGTANTNLFTRLGLTTQSTSLTDQIKSGSASVQSAIGTVQTALGGSASSVYSKITNVDNALLDTPTGVVVTDLATVRSLMLASPGATVEQDVRTITTKIGIAGTVAARLGDPGANFINIGTMIGGSGSNLVAKLGNSGGTVSLVGQIDSTSSNVQAAISSVFAALGGSGDIYSRVTSLNNGVLTTPTGGLGSDLATLKSLIVTTPGSTAQADVESINSLLNGTTTGSTIQDRIGTPLIGSNSTNLAAVLGGSNANIADQLGDPGNDHTLIDNIGGSTESVQAALNALATSLVNNTIFSNSLNTHVLNLRANVKSDATDLWTAINASRMAVGGSANNLYSKIIAVDNELLTVPTLVVRNDLTTLRYLMVPVLGATAQADVRELNNLLNGTPTGSTTQERIGVPTLNGSSSSLSSLIGGSETDISSQLGDPRTSSTGLASVINSGNASCQSLNCSDFNSADNLRDQLEAFILAMGQGGTLPPSNYTSLAEILSAMQ